MPCAGMAAETRLSARPACGSLYPHWLSRKREHCGRRAGLGREMRACVRCALAADCSGGVGGRGRDSKGNLEETVRQRPLAVHDQSEDVSAGKIDLPQRADKVTTPPGTVDDHDDRCARLPCKAR